jgi:hypothetical protein
MALRPHVTQQRNFLHSRHLILPCFSQMSTPIILGVGAIAAAIAGRTLIRRGVLGGRGAAQEWAKGGFKAKMDRKEALAILGLKCVSRSIS